jgi:O-antigen/teichoic acid export membrane protein
MQAATLAILARLLTPVDYGLSAIALVAIRPILQILFSPLERALVLQSQMHDAEAATLSGYIAFGGFCLSLLFALIALSLYFYFHSGPAAIVAAAYSPIFFFTSLGAVNRATLRREIEYGKLSAIDLSAQFGGGCVAAIFGALLGLGPYALALGMNVQALTQAIVSSSFRPLGSNADLRFEHIRPLLLSAWKIARNTLVEIAQLQLTPAFIGGNLGSGSLGIYSRSYSVIQLPAETVALSMTRVLFSGFAVVSGQISKLRFAAHNLLHIGGAITIPLCLAMVGARYEVVGVLLGGRWNAAADLIPWIAMGAIANLLAQSLAALSDAAGRFDSKLLIQIIVTVGSTATFLLLAHFHSELLTYAASYGVWAMAYFLGQVVLASDVLKISGLKILRWTFPGLGCGVLLLALNWTLHTSFAFWEQRPHGSLILLAGQVTICTIFPNAYYFLLHPGLAKDVLSYSGIRLPNALRECLSRYFDWRISAGSSSSRPASGA